VRRQFALDRRLPRTTGTATVSTSAVATVATSRVPPETVAHRQQQASAPTSSRTCAASSAFVPATAWARRKIGLEALMKV
jgi:hypothetical protein